MNTVKTPKGTELPLMNIKGKAYLQVAHRLVWFREERPTWSIITEILKTSDKETLARAEIRDETARLIATAHKSETAQGFPDHMEKAETGAIGRALALCGYGTQFTDELEEGGRLADSPVAAKHGPHPITPEQPSIEDGNLEPTSYKIPFGKWAQRSLEEIHRTQGADVIADYIDYLKESAKKKNDPLRGVVADFIVKATTFLKAIEGDYPGVSG